MPVPAAVRRRQTDNEAPFILVVEEHPDTRDWMAQVIRAEGFRVLEAGTVSGALALAQRHAPDIGLFILDIVVADTSGLDLAVQLQRGCAEGQYLYTSSYGSSIATQGLLLHRPECVLVKPFSRDQLIDKVTGLLKRPATA